MTHSSISTLRLALALVLLGFASLRADDQPVLFNRDIRPILAQNCFLCHGPDPGSRKASLRLDREESFYAARDNGPVIVKGKPEESPLYERLISKDSDEVMPPPKAHRTLKPEQIALLKGWIAEGAPWQPHWSFIKPERPPLPAVKDAAWPRNPIDHFILAKLEQAGLAPAAEADRRALARRVSLDLTGLPPEPALVEQFLADTAPDAYEKIVDLLLASPRYGEHRARYWLDAARYADTHGLHIDNYFEIWPYRDWVINALNANMPFDEFTIEQIAGDLLPHPTPAQLIATGFHRCNITTAEAGSIPEESLANYARDRVETTSWVWLGLTANCAVCHDHKFDPITTKDFYAMSAFFRNTTQEHTDKNARDPMPVLVMAQGKDAERWNAIPREIATDTAAIAARRQQIRPDFEKWYASAQIADLETRISGGIVSLPLNEGAGQDVHGWLGGEARTFSLATPPVWTPAKTGAALQFSKTASLDLGDLANFERDQPFTVSAWVFVPGAEVNAGSIIARMDVAHGDRGWDLNVRSSEMQVYLVNKWPDDAIVVTTAPNAIKRDEWRHVTVTYDGSGSGDGVRIYINGVENKARIDKRTVKGSIRSETPLTLGRRSAGENFIGSLQEVHVFDRVLSPLEIRVLLRTPEILPALAKPPAERTPPQRSLCFEYYAASDPDSAAASLGAVRLEAEKKAVQDRSTVSPIQEEKPDSKPIAHILYRGQYDQPREEVSAAVFSALHPLPENAPPNRLGLARWLVSPENPLTARVTVNRLWQEIFGAGIVKTTEDFGIMSEPPSHPELLDWLAVEFRESGWDMKHLVRLMVTSATYRQAALLTRDKIERDPQNRLFSRGPRFRMDAEMVRDAALSASGLLSAKIGGVSVKPYQPEGVWEAVAMPGSNTRDYKPDSGDALYRRSIYTFWKRTAPPPAMEVFNAPTRETSCLRRERTNTPLQALVTLNDPQFIEAARVLAERALEAALNDGESPLDTIAERLLARPLQPAELAIVKKTQRDLLAFYTAHPDETSALLSVGQAKPDPLLPAAQLAAWTMTCNQLMNLDEVLSK